MFGVAMKKEEKSTDSVVRNQKHSAQRENRTGIPTQLKERMEQSTGLSFDDVRVHYNSDLPAKLDALAYTQGNQVEIGPGQERHLPHELGHVVQQKLGVVRANAMHSSGVAMNTDPGLEHQADEIGAGKRIAIAQRMIHNIIQRFPRGSKTRRKASAPPKARKKSSTPPPTKRTLPTKTTVTAKGIPPAEIQPGEDQTIYNGLSYDGHETWTSPGGLVFGAGSIHGNRVRHVFDHTKEHPGKDTHTIFADKANLVALLDRAWSKRDIAQIKLQDNGNFEVKVSMGEEKVGTKNETNIVFIVKSDIHKAITSNIITAYPQ